MSFLLRQIDERGNIDNECAIYHCLADKNEFSALLADSEYISNCSIDHHLGNAYQFRCCNCKKDDVVFVHTKIGVAKSETQPSGMTIHHVYLGLNSAVWGDYDDRLTMLEL